VGEGLGERLRRLVQRPRSQPGDPEGQALRALRFDAVTEDDVYYCYRLLLERDPEPDGARQWAELLAQGLLTLPALVDGFLHSPERLALEAKRLEPTRVDLEGFHLWVRPTDPHIGLPLARDGRYEPHVTRALCALLRPGATFVDVGANVGYFSLLAATRVGPSGRVIAFEPRPDNVALLRRAVEENGFGQVEIHACAVAASEQEISFCASGSVQSSGRLMQAGEAGRELVPTVRAVALDTVLADAPRVDVIKMDIEGAEPLALDGMRAVLARHRPVIITEFCPALLVTTSGVEPRAYLDALAAAHDLYLLPHEGGAEQGPLTPERILALHAASGRSHFDLAARPRA
jgi:FkbM family methyltransferase